jgi:N-acetyl-gamma-glutamyl-phosphate reductase
MIKVGVVGATGYAGEELLKILLGHPKVKITALAAKVERPQKISEIFPYFEGKLELICGELDAEDFSKKCDLIFLALPHRISMEFAPRFLKKGKKIIDLSADYRLKDTSVYEKWYKTKHLDSAGLEEAVYGLPELNKEKIKKAGLVANPGCFPTGIILACAPLIASDMVDSESIIADSKSGVTGAGRTAIVPLIFGEVNENIKAYKVNQHQHAPEIDQELSRLAENKIEINFVPHLIPANRGILSTVYFKLKKKTKTKDLIKVMEDFYKGEPFVRIHQEGIYPQIKDVQNTNYCDIGVKVTNDLAIIISCIDNLQKGASSQAVQNMNLMCGFDEKEGLN